MSSSEASGSDVESVEVAATPIAVFVVADVPVSLLNEFLNSLTTRSETSDVFGEEAYAVSFIDKTNIEEDPEPAVAPLANYPRSFIGADVKSLKKFMSENIYEENENYAQEVFIVIDQKSTQDKTALLVSNNEDEPGTCRAEFALATEILTPVEVGSTSLNEGMPRRMKKNGQYYYTVAEFDAFMNE